MTSAARGILLAEESVCVGIIQETCEGSDLTRAWAAEKGQGFCRIEEYHITCHISIFGPNVLETVPRRAISMLCGAEEYSGK
jgi:hypothetical protein